MNTFVGICNSSKSPGICGVMPDTTLHTSKVELRPGFMITLSGYVKYVVLQIWTSNSVTSASQWMPFYVKNISASESNLSWQSNNRDSIYICIVKW